MTILPATRDTIPRTEAKRKLVLCHWVLFTVPDLHCLPRALRGLAFDTCQPTNQYQRFWQGQHSTAAISQGLWSPGADADVRRCFSIVVVVVVVVVVNCSVSRKPTALGLLACTKEHDTRSALGLVHRSIVRQRTSCICIWRASHSSCCAWLLYDHGHGHSHCHCHDHLHCRHCRIILTVVVVSIRRYSQLGRHPRLDTHIHTKFMSALCV
ncbi:hypothetical protein F5B21DRAFT_53780 [Xylaria acuta]|nr:hypothetical protein F5B21DRAFT_53780 [Xylaria acuta]